ncbi:phage tail sheath C-terminal domain-containing protein [Massilia sp. W12]|uniref:phage tail sheath family protein n=1 Tax=Massilia sp. W12 TaxID=3126507 RepID=UPI0030CC0D16
MPVSVSYPGVYIEEVPSGVRTIAGVATSITAFIGRAARGPVDQAVTLDNFGEFERTFGKLHADYPMAYAVRDFFLNGGGTAVIVRLFKDKASALGQLKVTNLTLQPANPGTWGAALRVRLDGDIPKDSGKRFGLADEDLFNLTVNLNGALEVFRNLSVKEGPRRVDRVLAAESQWLRVDVSGDYAQSPSLKTGVRPSLHDPVTDPSKLWSDDKLSTGVSDAAKLKDSDALDVATWKGSETDGTGVYALKQTDLFNLLCMPPDTRDGETPKAVLDEALAYCTRRRAMLIIDPPKAWNSVAKVSTDDVPQGDAARNAAVFFPRLLAPDPARNGQLDSFVPCGAIAGVFARTDATRGVWKAPAGLDASLQGSAGLSVVLSDPENGRLNQIGVNCLRSFPNAGRVVWGARTLRGADQLADEYKYIPVRRLALYIEESLYRGSQWAVFEPNDEPLWGQLRMSLGAFMHNLFRQGAFQGASAREAYFVKCDKETTTQNDINLGIVNVVVGFAPLKPAEFVVIKLQQIAGQLAV